MTERAGNMPALRFCSTAFRRVFFVFIFFLSPKSSMRENESAARQQGVRNI